MDSAIDRLVESVGIRATTKLTCRGVKRGTSGTEAVGCSALLARCYSADGQMFSIDGLIDEVLGKLPKRI